MREDGLLLGPAMLRLTSNQVFLKGENSIWRDAGQVHGELDCLKRRDGGDACGDASGNASGGAI